ncbi:MAG: CXXX repeat peptide maturase [Pseudoflavonifractor sp.]|nr:CXXX repeat peptide maturase [Pseudoflavonifractor sp.]
MLKYLIVILDDTSVSFCHYDNNSSDRRLIPIDDLKSGLIWAMKENLMVQFVYPSGNLPKEYAEIIDTIDHIDITPNTSNGDVVIFNGIDSIQDLTEKSADNIILRLNRKELFNGVDDLVSLINKSKSYRIIVNDITDFDESDFQNYKSVLGELSQAVENVIASGNGIQISPVTDRMQLTEMNNCNAGVESITLAPDGKFYICPAFYYDGLSDVGNPKDGFTIPNQRLLKLEYAPICRKCDAYHCKRCVWLNQKTTLEVNTPSHEQCVVSHLERNESKRLLNSLKEKGKIRTSISIPEIEYLDPFEIIKS